MAEKYYSFSSYNYTLNNPIKFIDPNGTVVDNYTIYSDGTIYKEDTDDNTNTYTYVNLDNRETTDLGTYEKETNSYGEDMTKVGNGASGENDFLSWNNITSGNLYFEEDAFAGLLGGVKRFYDNVGQDVDNVQLNQLMSLNRVHSNKGNRHSALDVAFYRQDGTTGALATDDDISDNINTSLLNTLKDFGLGSKVVYTSVSATSSTKYLNGTTGLAGHHHHFHFDGFDNPVGVQLPEVTIKKRRLLWFGNFRRR